MRDPDWNDIEQELRRPARVDPTAVSRIMDEVLAEPVPLRRPRPWEALLRPRAVRVSPLWALAQAAVLMLAVVGALSLVRGRPGAAPPGGPAVADVARPERVRFVLVAQDARQVSLVGDFNDWSAGATPMASTGTPGVWAVDVALEPGRHLYAFLVDGERWMPDPAAARGPEDEFGTPNSVVLVGES